MAESKTGFISEVGPVEQVGKDGQTKRQLIVLHIPAYTYQDREIEEEHWQFAIIGPQVDKLDLNIFHVGERAKVNYFQKSKKFEKDGRTMYIVNNRAVGIDWLQK